ncbi:fumarate reductase/succinate dehydrogenase flavoprotein domain protein [Gordonia bronchialis DSM 43247]|uniref:Fumarate reductase/succinate dehydrogenase flavoprotein domain protein n=1 Tax=Gordonia bronchialis (strain ATCC 25592 / DSM 43247 / BCRC 13721 / JCM 3198 / KCTC 3076 / NBRC 16047 / NCTC 10667) TaxID=526226 RepID=D0L7A4_GORB4|nr:FAD-binding dehydrogenase [Gordonia bronchialis]ACY23693.1 fumarate reductase/succinate dehydrogenase flavoprotein domain protein [Gordonia bronchialis DSM 43247]MCC3321859.1 FAD-binding dehydrogenase [Gordonia bronchialis]QGS22981.1 FAD-binding dehydrogenase [Gordonia bronchialis]UAK36728.1 FAD-binding dehydrogenase [Gordonia bronchialis]STQ66703.1 KsdD-like steroid dehydrogenase MSMEG_5835 [Gordonia bronchialis]
MSEQQADAVVVGAGLAGLVATYELTQAGRKVIVVDQENRNNLGGQAFWSLGGLFLVDSPEQRRLGIHDSAELALQDWMGSAGFDRDDEDFWPRQWARAYVEFAATEKRQYLHDLGLRITPVVGWAERGGGFADGHGNSVPRFHLTWGTGPEVVRVFAEPVLEAEARGLVEFRFRHQVDDLIVDGDQESGTVVGVRGSLLAPTDLERGRASSRDVVGDFEIRADAVIVTTGGIGHNHELIRRNWPTERLGPAPETMISGVPAHVDGRMLGIAEDAGASIVNRDRMWHYTEGIHNWDPIWPDHAIRIIPGPSSLWLDANGNRLAPPNFPGFDTNSTMKAILATGYDYSWFILTQTIIEKEFALSGSEQNPDITSKDLKFAVKSRLAKGAPGPVDAFKRNGVDFVVADNLPELVTGMNAIARGPDLDLQQVERVISARDAQLDNKYSKDAQIMAITNARQYLGDKVVRVAKPHRLLDPAHGPLIAVRLNILTRKTLGGLETNLDAQVMRPDGTAFDGLYAAGEVAGFGGGGVHGYNALEGTFLGGCIFSGRAAGRAVARL